MKIIVFGATGNTGKRVLASGIKKGHEMTAFVRSPEKLYEQQGEQIARQVKVVTQNIMDPQCVYEALSHQDAAVIAAGNVGNGEEFTRIVDNIVTQCEDHPLFSGRVWLMGGAGLLEIPHTNIIGNDLPGIPPIFQYHNQNLKRLQQTKLDWSMMCPGTMVDAAEESTPEHLNITADILPLPFPETVRELSEAELAGQLFNRFEELNVSYEDVANCMLNHLEVAGPFRNKRVGIAYRREI
jgi:putative NADH-flavin reductase